MERRLANSPARSMVARLVGYPSGQRGQTVNLLAYAFDGSNPSPTTIFSRAGRRCDQTSRNPHGKASIHGHHFAGDVVVFDEERDGFGDLLGRAFAMQRDALLEIYFFLLGAHVRVEGGADDAGGDAVDADVVVAEFAGERARELRQRAFDNLIRGIGDDAANARNGRDQNDCTFFFCLHGRNDGAAQVKNSVDMEVEGGVPGFGREIEQAAVHGAAGTMHED